MVQFVVIGRDGGDPDALSRRMRAREGHLALADTMRSAGTLLHAAALLDDAGKMVGSVMTLEFASRADLDAWLVGEPYVVQKVWHDVEVHACKVAPAFAPRTTPSRSK